MKQQKRSGFSFKASVHRGWHRSNWQESLFPLGWVENLTSKCHSVFFNIQSVFYLYHKTTQAQDQSITITGWGRCGLWFMSLRAEQTKPPTQRRWLLVFSLLCWDLLSPSASHVILQCDCVNLCRPISWQWTQVPPYLRLWSWSRSGRSDSTLVWKCLNVWNFQSQANQ